MVQIKHDVRGFAHRASSLTSTYEMLQVTRTKIGMGSAVPIFLGVILKYFQPVKRVAANVG